MCRAGTMKLPPLCFLVEFLASGKRYEKLLLVFSINLQKLLVSAGWIGFWFWTPFLLLWKCKVEYVNIYLTEISFDKPHPPVKFKFTVLPVSPPVVVWSIHPVTCQNQQTADEEVSNIVVFKSLPSNNNTISHTPCVFYRQMKLVSYRG